VAAQHPPWSWSCRAHGAPAHLLSSVHVAALEEVWHALTAATFWSPRCFVDRLLGFLPVEQVRHAEAAYALASSYLGVQVGPGALDTSASGATGSLSDLAVSTAREACVAETVAAIEAQLSLGACAAPAVCAALAVVAKDEFSHAALAWRELESLGHGA